MIHNIMTRSLCQRKEEKQLKHDSFLSIKLKKKYKRKAIIEQYHIQYL